MISSKEPYYIVVMGEARPEVKVKQNFRIEHNFEIILNLSIFL